MAARRLWIGLAIEVALYLLALLLIRRFTGQVSLPTAVIAICSAMVFVRAALVFVSFALSEPLDDAAPLRASERIDMWLREGVAFFRFQRLIMMARKEPSPNAHSTQDTAPLVVLLHGILCNGAIWRPIAQRLADRGHCEVRTPSLPRVTASLAEQTADFSAWLAQTARANPRRPIIVVGHSLGGLIALRCARERQRAAQIATVICIGAPHQGSDVARLLPSPIARDICPGSPAVAHRMSGQTLDASVLNIYAVHDNLVVPAASSKLDHARNIALPACGHMALIYSQNVFDLLVAEIESVSRAALRLQVPLGVT